MENSILEISILEMEGLEIHTLEWLFSATSSNNDNDIHVWYFTVYISGTGGVTRV